MSNGFRVNTDELEAVVSRLRNLQQQIGQTGTKSKYDTVVTQKDLGGDFNEAKALTSTHEDMQQFLSQTIADLESLINDFGDKTKTVTDAYKSREDEGKVVMNDQQARLV